MTLYAKEEDLIQMLRQLEQRLRVVERNSIVIGPAVPGGFNDAGQGLTYSGSTIYIDPGHGLDVTSDSISVDETELDAGLIGGFDNGIYTPTLTEVSNLDSQTAYQHQYLQVGDIVNVSGKITVDVTSASTPANLLITLPVASNIGAEEDVAGTAVGGINGVGMVMGNAANDCAELSYYTTDQYTGQSVFLTFQYQVI